MAYHDYEPTWSEVRVWAEDKLQELRDDLERDIVEWEDVIRIRADITRLRELLGLPEGIENGSVRIDTDRLDR